MVNKLGIYLRKQREDQALSVRELARRSGVSYSYIAQLERGEDPQTGKAVSPTQDILEKLANGLGVTYEEFMTAAGYINPKLVVVASQDEYTPSPNAGSSVKVLTPEPDNPIPEQQILAALTDDPELLAFWQETLRREDLQLLFKQTAPLSPDGIKRVIRYIKMVEDEESQEND